MSTLRQEYKSEYDTWASMRSRCSNPNSQKYEGYGGRGITVCKRWDSFALFIKDMGPRPTGLSIDRKDNNKGYEPSNCRWATMSEQINNQRTRKTNKSGMSGVHWSPWANRWLVKFQGLNIGRFKDFNEACQTRKEAEDDYASKHA